jgi:hypothetical protein
VLAGNIGYTRHRLKTKKSDEQSRDTVLAGNTGYTRHRLKTKTVMTNPETLC